MAVLSSDWGGLSPHLLAAFYPVAMERQGDTRSFRRVGDTVVAAPISDASMEQTANWTSPFENQTPDAGFSTFSHMLQAGALEPILNALERVAPGAAAGGFASIKEGAATLAGRSSMTKLNSTQIYNGSPPMKITLTALFRAISNPDKEVMAPVAQLFSWMLPEQLADNSLATNAVDAMASGKTGVGDILRTIYPSLTPSIIGMVYQGKEYMPMVIESISKPMDCPVTADGKTTFTTLQMQISSLTALDRADFLKMGFR
jgi:hypothetical protein